MKVTENSDEIIIRHIPVREWATGGVLTSILFGFFLWFAYSVFVSRNGLPKAFSGDCLPVFIIGAAVLLVFFEIRTVSAPLVTVTIRKGIKAVDIRLQRFYGSRINRFHFTQIGKFKSYKGKINFSQQYFLALVLANNKVLKLNIPIGGDKQNTIKFIKKLNKFIKFKGLSEEQ